VAALSQAPNSGLYNLLHSNSDLLSIDEATADRIAKDWAKERKLADEHDHPLEKNGSLGPMHQFVVKKLIVEELLNRESKLWDKGKEVSKASARSALKEELTQYCYKHPVLQGKLFNRQRELNKPMLNELYDAIGKGDAKLYDQALTQEHFVGIREIAEGLKRNVGIPSANERVTKVLEEMKNQIGSAKLSLTMRDLTEVSSQVEERSGFGEKLLGAHAADYTLSKMLIDRIVIEPAKQEQKLRNKMHQAVAGKLAGELQSLYNKNFRDADSLFTDRKLDSDKFWNLYSALGGESQVAFDNLLSGKTENGKETRTAVKAGAKVSNGVLAAVAGGGLVLSYLGGKQEDNAKQEAEMRGEQPKSGGSWLKWGGVLLTLGAIGYGVYQYMNGKNQAAPALAKA
jgi:hypothetical protein